jgi:hypothetical protein
MEDRSADLRAPTVTRSPPQEGFEPLAAPGSDPVRPFEPFKSRLAYHLGCVRENAAEEDAVDSSRSGGERGARGRERGSISRDSSVRGVTVAESPHSAGPFSSG